MNYFKTSKMLKLSCKLLPLIVLLCSCGGLGSQVIELGSSSNAKYDYATPKYKGELKSDLQEISGLAYDDKAHALLAINDEQGNVYKIDTDYKAGRKLFEFHKAGDYEGITIDGKHVYILKSNGKLYRYNTQKEKTKVIETPLSSKNDAEGLCYDANIHSLLIACKGLPLNEKKNIKAVYRYSIKDEKFKKEPVIEIDIKQLEALAEENDMSGNNRWRIKRFSPSGIAIHPMSQNYYILSARGSMLLVINQQQKIERLVFLDTKALPQPEGICFDADNNLFIASEGKGGNGKLLMFKAID